MSLASVFVLLGFLAFFLVLVPLGIWLFARFFPQRGGSVFGFPEQDPRNVAAADPAAPGPRIRRTPEPPKD
jgi:hypothetical protein